MILKIFSPKNSAKKLAFLTQNKAKLCKILIVTLVFEKNANIFAENRQKSQKIVIITSTPGRPACVEPDSFSLPRNNEHVTLK
jgi:predicted dinucleotide-binding enzyme